MWKQGGAENTLGCPTTEHDEKERQGRLYTTSVAKKTHTQPLQDSLLQS